MSKDLAHVQCQELFVVFEHLINQQANQRVFVDVAQENLNVIMNFDLVLQIEPHIAHQKAVALVNQLLVMRVIY